MADGDETRPVICLPRVGLASASARSSATTLFAAHAQNLQV